MFFVLARLALRVPYRVSNLDVSLTCGLIKLFGKNKRRDLNYSRYITYCSMAHANKVVSDRATPGAGLALSLDPIRYDADFSSSKFYTPLPPAIALLSRTRQTISLSLQWYTRIQRSLIAKYVLSQLACVVIAVEYNNNSRTRYCTPTSNETSQTLFCRNRHESPAHSCRWF